MATQDVTFTPPLCSCCPLGSFSSLCLLLTLRRPCPRTSSEETLGPFPPPSALRAPYPRPRAILLLVIPFFHSFPPSGWDQSVVKTNTCPFACCLQCRGTGYVCRAKSPLPLSVHTLLPVLGTRGCHLESRGWLCLLSSLLHIPCLEQCGTAGIW